MKTKILLLLMLLSINVIAQNFVSDIDGNSYPTIVINNKVWMQDNLKTSHYRNGSSIPTGLSNQAWQLTLTGACADYNNIPANSLVYGKLYNWYSIVDPSGLCPNGWHVANESDWNDLILSIDPNANLTCNSCQQSGFAGSALQNINGWHGLLGGSRQNTTYAGLGTGGFWWSSTAFTPAEAFVRLLGNNYNSVGKNFASKYLGYSVRCVYDQSASVWTGQNENFIKSISALYPNPTNGLVYIESNKMYEGVSVFDMLGKLVLSYKAEKIIDLSCLQDGVYQLQFVFENGVEQRRVEVSH
ncbi:MAG: FISUMP domain-containing protein [Bacteroidota bacterium]